MKRILIIDQSKDILHLLKKTFHHSDYHVVTADSGLSALEILKIVDVDIVISDLRIPLMDGFELLSEIRENHPDVIRIIMVNYADESSALKAIQQNIAKYYILKPWNEDNLREYIGQIVTTEVSLKSKELLYLIKNIDKLPTIETSYQKVLHMIEKDSDFGFISAEIEKDFSISSKLLQIANSAYYGLRTGSVRNATVYLGLSNLKSLIYSTAILNSFDSLSEQDQQRVKHLWTHALLTNKLLHFIYEEFLCRKLSEDAYSAGLLHNIGTLILIYNRVEDYAGVMKQVNPQLCNLLDAEQAAFSVTHQEAGGYLASFWKLPFPIVEAALYHHRPFDSGVMNKELVYAVHLAQHYAWQLTKQPAVTEFYSDIFTILNISKDDFEAAVNWRTWV